MLLREICFSLKRFLTLNREGARGNSEGKTKAPTIFTNYPAIHVDRKQDIGTAFVSGDGIMDNFHYFSLCLFDLLISKSTIHSLKKCFPLHNAKVLFSPPLFPGRLLGGRAGVWELKCYSSHLLGPGGLS